MWATMVVKNDHMFESQQHKERKEEIKKHATAIVETRTIRSELFVVECSWDFRFVYEVHVIFVLLTGKVFTMQRCTGAV